MKQISQSIINGRVEVRETLTPGCGDNDLVIANICSVISAGTEKMVGDLAKRNIIGKAIQRPQEVKKVIEKIKKEGVVSTVRAVREKLSEPIILGYSSSGYVLACGKNVRSIKPGDRVASNGPHGEVVRVPKNLCGRIPENVSDEQAAFAVIGSIALHAVRSSKARLGGRVLVIGLGLIGQICIQILNAQDCQIIGVDPDSSKCELALKMGASAAMTVATGGEIKSHTENVGVDAVLVTAATDSNEPIDLAASSVRKKGKVILVGVVGLNLSRKQWYSSEAEFSVSCSYGPGRYDPEYEDRGNDYPLAYVCWTEQRNIQSFLNMVGHGKIDLHPLITHRFRVEEAKKAYEVIEKGEELYLGIVLNYQGSLKKTVEKRRIELRANEKKGNIGIGVLGSGKFARMILLPAIIKTGKFRPRIIASQSGFTATHSGERLGFEAAASDEEEVFKDPVVDAVFVITRHDLHASQVVKAIKAGKHVFTEKPLAITIEEIASIEEALVEAGEKASLLTVGFNRRFSPAAKAVKEHFGNVVSPLTISIRFNAGEIPPDHWTQNMEEGGGRIIGEACHAIDLATYLAGSPPTRVFAESIGGRNAPKITDDQVFITLRHANGSVSSVAYLAGGDKSFPKERVEVFGGGRVAVIDDFRSVTLVANGKTKRKKGWSQDKGHRAEIKAFSTALNEGSEAPISWDDIKSVSIASIMAVRSLREGFPIDIPI